MRASVKKITAPILGKFPHGVKGNSSNVKEVVLGLIPQMEISRESQLAMIDEGIKRVGTNIHALEKDADIPVGSIKDLRRGKLPLRSDKWEKIKAVLFPVEETAVKIPICGQVPGGLPVEVEAAAPDEYVYYSLKKNISKNIGALKVSGDSMNNVAPDGSYIIVDFNQRDGEHLEGKPVIVRIDGECTFKRFYRDPDLLVPDSTNKSHKPIALKADWEILGLVIGVINRLED